MFSCSCFSFFKSSSQYERIEEKPAETLLRLAKEADYQIHEKELKRQTLIIENYRNTIYQAKWKKLPTQPVVLKMLKISNCNKEDAQELGHEAMILQSLQALHIPDVVTYLGKVIYKKPSDKNTPALVLEYLPGKNVLQFLYDPDKPDQPDISLPEKYKLLKDATGIVANLHEHNYIHADLKWENFVLKGAQLYEGIKLIDFGLSKKLDACAEFVDTPRNTGTASYTSPEIRASGKMSKSSDTFSLGVMMFILFERMYPFGKDAAYAQTRLDYGYMPMMSDKTPTLVAQMINECLRTHACLRPDVRDLHQRITMLEQKDQAESTMRPGF
jgi:serine/threonine protein kinase